MNKTLGNVLQFIQSFIHSIIQSKSTLCWWTKHLVTYYSHFIQSLCWWTKHLVTYYNSFNHSIIALMNKTLGNVLQFCPFIHSIIQSLCWWTKHLVTYYNHCADEPLSYSFIQSFNHCADEQNNVLQFCPFIHSIIQSFNHCADEQNTW